MTLALRALLTPCLDPQVKHVVEIDVRQQRRHAAALRRSLLHSRSLSLFQHAGVQPFLNEPHDAPVRDSVLEKLDEPSVVDGVEERTDVHIEHPVHLLRQQSDVERIQRVMLAASGSEAVREAEEVRLVDGVQHVDRGPLDDFVFQHGHAERPLPPVGLRDVRPPHRLRSIRTPLQPLREVLEIRLQRLLVVPPRLAVHARCGVLLQREERRPQARHVAHVVQQRGEPHLPIPSCRLAVSAPAHWARRSGAESGTRFAGADFLRSAPFPPLPPRPVARRRSAASLVLRGGPTSQSRSSSACVVSTSRRGPRVHPPRVTLGSPGSRAWCVRACTGSLTARGPDASRDGDAPGVAFRFSLQRRHPGEKHFRG